MKDLSQTKWHGIPRTEIPWFPTVGAQKRFGCELCFVTCGREVYEIAAARCAIPGSSALTTARWAVRPAPWSARQMLFLFPRATRSRRPSANTRFLTLSVKKPLKNVPNSRLPGHANAPLKSCARFGPALGLRLPASLATRRFLAKRFLNAKCS